MYYLLLILIIFTIDQGLIYFFARKRQKRYERFDTAKFLFKRLVLYPNDAHTTKSVTRFWATTPDRYKAELFTDIFHWALHHQYTGVNWTRWCNQLRLVEELPELLTGDAYTYPKFLEYTKYSDTYNTF